LYLRGLRTVAQPEQLFDQVSVAAQRDLDRSPERGFPVVEQFEYRREQFVEPTVRDHPGGRGPGGPVGAVQFVRQVTDRRRVVDREKDLRCAPHRVARQSGRDLPVARQRPGDRICVISVIEMGFLEALPRVVPDYRVVEQRRRRRGGGAWLAG